MVNPAVILLNGKELCVINHIKTCYMEQKTMAATMAPTMVPGNAHKDIPGNPSTAQKQQDQTKRPQQAVNRSVFSQKKTGSSG